VSGAIVSGNPPSRAPYAGHTLEVFGLSRVMFGSDWPVCLLAADYSRVARAAEQLTADPSRAECDDVFGGTACRYMPPPRPRRSAWPCAPYRRPSTWWSPPTRAPAGPEPRPAGEGNVACLPGRPDGGNDRLRRGVPRQIPRPRFVPPGLGVGGFAPPTAEAHRGALGRPDRSRPVARSSPPRTCAGPTTSRRRCTTRSPRPTGCSVVCCRGTADHSLHGSAGRPASPDPAPAPARQTRRRRRDDPFHDTPRNQTPSVAANSALTRAPELM
jgi:hypothetical protein